MTTLTPKERRALRARAHPLHPVIMIGEAGLTPAVLHEIDNALKGRDLIKIRVLGHDRTARAALIGEICAALDASPVQQIGKILVVFRPPKPGTDHVFSSPGLPKKRGLSPVSAPRRSGRARYRPKRHFQN